METMRDILRYRNHPKGEVGIEIEVEGVNLAHMDTPVWFTTDDGSLKADEAYEYVLRQPVDREGIMPALRELQEAWEKRGSKIDESFRAGTHVHINVQTLTPKQVLTFACLYLIFEDILVDYCGEHRVGNHFCLRLRDAEYLLFKLEDAFREKDFKALYTDKIRYASINFKALVKYGSLEFRSMRSTSKLQDIYHWTNLLLMIKDYAIGVENPTDILMDLSMYGPDRLYEKVFGPLQYEDSMSKSIIEGMRRVQGLLYIGDRM